MISTENCIAIQFLCQSAGARNGSSTKTTKAKQPKGCDAKLKGLTPNGYGSQLPKGVYVERTAVSRRFFAPFLWWFL